MMIRCLSHLVVLVLASAVLGSAALAAASPRSAGVRDAKEPPNLPMGGRAADKTKTGRMKGEDYRRHPEEGGCARDDRAAGIGGSVR